MAYKTSQEQFWAGSFGDEYISRNQGESLLASNLNFFSKALERADKPGKIIEFGANIGMNLRALQLLFPEAELAAIEINQAAASQLAQLIGDRNTHNVSILDFKASEQYDLAFIKGVLIHINPAILPEVYEKIYLSSSKYILLGEYYNPSPVTIPYRGHTDRLFKRDFAGELLDRYSDLHLVDYGFAYRRDPSFPQDDINWFLLEKK
ncbi:pseudaminic acid biosynthesis-associated methylase [Neolewinella sp.]|uniref:pseudaminic acid biosynthesis-associated methylase n=1 Tax=Neolewinella sp. TaxID=2993543 RepID=UPI003B51F75A